MPKQQDTSLLAQVMEETIKQSEQAQNCLKTLFAEIQPKPKGIKKSKKWNLMSPNKTYSMILKNRSTLSNRDYINKSVAPWAP
ncbi:hypothetical protein PN36_32835 [Candidatus Thiomargarita nelsonii]|uniref:Uncharacterized protein n=1 Tax=Candidatus Thiomargarita nelsonii TaxID=1003181 RepID=A0A0A6P9T1_9GAMM|nr:hypothetical protein PN36_32835 [Candidatus Thiomargarita nelsonii]